MGVELYFIVLFVTGFFAGLVDAIAGGGGLIQLPVLLTFGVSPIHAIGVNRFSSTFGCFSASLNFVWKGHVNPSEMRLGVVVTAVSAMIGAIVVQSLDPGFLKKFIPVLLTLIFLYTLFAPKLGAEDIKARMGKRPFYLLFGILLGFYDGFFGPGAGSFWLISFVTLLGFNFLKATAYTKIVNFTSNFFSLIFFIILGNVLFAEGCCMACGNYLGGKAGSSLVIKKGAKFVRPFFLTVVGATILKLFYDNFF